MSLFDKSSPENREYENIRTLQNEACGAARTHCEDLWKIYKPLADRNFATEFRTNFLDRYWEMYLTVSLIDMGHEVFCPKPVGPDVGIVVDGRRIWFEATCPGPGQAGTLNYIAEPEMGRAYWVPEEKIILRYLSGISTKMTIQYEAWIRSGAVSAQDCIVIALNPKKIPFEHGDTVPPRILQAAFPVGNQVLQLDRNTGDVSGTGFQFRKMIAKSASTSITTGAFEEYKQLSGLLCSRISPWMIHSTLGEDYQFVANPWSVNSCPPALRLRGTNYGTTIAGNRITIDEL